MATSQKQEYESFGDWAAANLKKVVLLVLLVVGGIFALTAVFKSFYTVPAGNRGLVFNWGALDKTPIEPGLHMKVPYKQHVELFNVQMRESRFEKLGAASSDAQQVISDIAVNFEIIPSMIGDVRETYGGWEGFAGGILHNAIQQTYKDITAQYKANAILANREKISQQLHEQLVEKLKDFRFVNIVMTTVNNIDFSPEYAKAIEEKQVAEQEAQKAVYQAQQAKNMAEAQINEARGRAEAAKLLRIQTDKTVLARMWIDKWDGSLPQVLTGSNQGMMLNLQNLGTKTAPAKKDEKSKDDE
ncbi:SPFH domain / Band 7 family protein [uncultured archaeon]|nr:SPFH domain / Band 7 family protein [uncultured archaeon]